MPPVTDAGCTGAAEPANATVVPAGPSRPEPVRVIVEPTVTVVGEIVPPSGAP